MYAINFGERTSNQIFQRKYILNGSDLLSKPRNHKEIFDTHYFSCDQSTSCFHSSLSNDDKCMEKCFSIIQQDFREKKIMAFVPANEIQHCCSKSDLCCCILPILFLFLQFSFYVLTPVGFIFHCLGFLSLNFVPEARPSHVTEPIFVLFLVNLNTKEKLP